MTSGFFAVHVCGDLGQAVATDEGGSWLFDGGEPRLATHNEVSLFFAHGLEIRSLNSELDDTFDEDHLGKVLRAETEKFTALRAVLQGMDQDLTAPTRLKALHTAWSEFRDDKNLTFVRRRVLRSPDFKAWIPKSAAELARKADLNPVAELYDILATDLLWRIETAIDELAKRGRYKSPADLQALARETGVVTDFALATHRQSASLRAEAAAAQYDGADFIRSFLDQQLPLPTVEAQASADFLRLRDQIARDIANASSAGSVFSQQSRGTSVFRFNRDPLDLTELAPLERIATLLAVGRDVDPDRLLELSLGSANQRLFFLPRPGTRLQSHRLSQILEDDLNFDRRRLPAIKAWSNLARGEAMSLRTILKLDQAIQELLSRSRFDREFEVLRPVVEAQSVIPSVFHAAPQFLHDLREYGLQMSQRDISRKVFGAGRQNTWRLLEAFGENGRQICVTWATVQEMARGAEPYGDDVRENYLDEFQFHRARLSRFNRFGRSDRFSRFDDGRGPGRLVALSRADGNRVEAPTDSPPRGSV